MVESGDTHHRNWTSEAVTWHVRQGLMNVVKTEAKFDDKQQTAAAAKSLQSCPNLCDPRDGSPPGSPVPGILQARTLEWVAISFSDAWKWKVKGNSRRCKNEGSGLPSGPMVKTSSSNTGVQVGSLVGGLRSHNASWPKNQNTKQK